MNISVFFPAYNEEGNLRNTVESAVMICRQLEEVEKFEVIVVNDGSSDNTAQIAEDLARKYEEVNVIHHETNRGYGAALKTGLYNSRYEWIIFTDSDGQFDFAEVSKFINASKEGPDLILGYKIKRADPIVRKINSKLWGILMKVFFGLNVRDRACGFKMLKKAVVDELSMLETDGAVAEDELLIRAKKAGFVFKEVPVHHYPRISGEQTGAKLDVILEAFREILYLWRVLRD